MEAGIVGVGIGVSTALSTAVDSGRAVFVGDKITVGVNEGGFVVLVAS